MTSHAVEWVDAFVADLAFQGALGGIDILTTMYGKTSSPDYTARSSPATLSYFADAMSE